RKLLFLQIAQIGEKLVFCDFRVTVFPLISGYLPLPRPFARVARSLGCGERCGLSFEKIFDFFNAGDVETERHL
uniref:hypothetical protein n=1 Tax=Candidatus Arsenophonus triatominarum TaxID=57911 RepID=UPI000AC2E729